MSFLKHVGKIGDRKVVVLYREVPNEPHMCLVCNTETLNAHIHDPLMQALESDIGQTTQTFAEALNRSYTRDGKIILQVLHQEGLIKKVQTSQVIMTPNAATKIRLDELNTILDQMEQGEAAVKKLEDLDSQRGLQSPADVARRMRENKEAQTQAAQPPIQSSAQGYLADNQIANNLLVQARKMEAEAKGLLAESNRLQQEANQLLGVPTSTQIAEKAATVSVDQPAKRGRGRPAKAKTLA